MPLAGGEGLVAGIPEHLGQERQLGPDGLQSCTVIYGPADNRIEGIHARHQTGPAGDTDSSGQASHGVGPIKTDSFLYESIQTWGVDVGFPRLGMELYRWSSAIITSTLGLAIINCLPLQDW